LVGASNVGKTTFLQRLLRDQFLLEREETIGAEYESMHLDNDKNIKIQFLDLGGSERHQVLVASHYKDTRIVFLFAGGVSGVDFSSQLERLKISKSMIQSENTGKKIHYFLVFTKQDEEVVPEAQGVSFRRDLEISEENMLVCSAKNGFGFDEVKQRLSTVAKDIHCLQSAYEKKLSLFEKLKERCDQYEVALARAYQKYLLKSKQKGVLPEKLVEIKMAAAHQQGSDNLSLLVQKQAMLERMKRILNGTEEKNIENITSTLQAFHALCMTEAKTLFLKRRDPFLGMTRHFLQGVAIVLGVLGFIGLAVAMGVTKATTGRWCFWKTTGEQVIEDLVKLVKSTPGV